MQFINKMVVRCRTGRYVDHLDHPLWDDWSNEELYVQGSGDNTIITLANRNWAEYLSSDFFNNCFEAEGYYLEIDPSV